MVGKLLLCFVLCGCSLLQAFGPQKKPAQSYVLKAARMFDGKSDHLATRLLIWATQRCCRDSSTRTRI